MAEESGEFPYSEPFKITKRGEETEGEVYRAELTVYPSGDDFGDDEVLSHRRHIIDFPSEHIHPHQEERITVLSGEYAVVFEGSEHRLSEGDEITMPKNTPHRHWNPTVRPTRIRQEFHPALQAEEFYETTYALAQAGKTDEKGLPGLLQIAVLYDTYPGHAYMPGLPVSVQNALSKILAPVGRAVGCEAPYSRKDIDDLREP